MSANGPLEELPVLLDYEKKNKSNRICDDLQIAVIQGKLPNLPEYFRTEVYVIQFVAKGGLIAEINNHKFNIDAHSMICVFPNHILHLSEVYEDTLIYALSFSAMFSKELGLNISSELKNKIYVRPTMEITEEQLKVCLDYLSLLQKTSKTADPSTIQEASLHLLRSLLSYNIGIYETNFEKKHSLSRAEELTGRFLSLVDTHSYMHHSIGWYASEMCLSKKYLSNVVKQVTGESPGYCINETLLRLAKSLLLTTNLTIQQISERLGFINQSHFGTFFRRATGQSPLKFRKQTGTIYKE